MEGALRLGAGGEQTLERLCGGPATSVPVRVPTGRSGIEAGLPTQSASQHGSPGAMAQPPWSPCVFQRAALARISVRRPPGQVSGRPRERGPWSHPKGRQRERWAGVLTRPGKRGVAALSPGAQEAS
ncbi:unnamed protein product [Soboliphyme baturini]|uniref:cDNA n=1 Tax=Soboliphyme baturini TaxID=241478 RepID=A0A183I9Z4_9BILA|nr:unnamed protein product [Soboliphyme baturini]